MNSISKILENVTLNTEYDFFRRNYERDQASIEKAFWMNVIASIYPGQRFDFYTLYKLYVDLLYDKPALELRLHENLAKHLGEIPESFSEEEINNLKEMVDRSKNIKQELTDVIHKIKASFNKGEKTAIAVDTRYNYQPYLPSASEIIYLYRVVTQNTLEPKELYFPRATEISISELNRIRKKANSYFPYYLLGLSIQKLEEAKNFGRKEIIPRLVVSGASEAVSTELSKYPWNINLSDEQLCHIVFHNYCTIEEQDGTSKVNLLENTAISKAIRRFRGKEN